YKLRLTLIVVVEVVEEMKMYHIMVYNHGLRIYSYPYAVHIFTSKKLSPKDAFKLADEILSKHYPKWRDRANLAYVGYEELPLSFSFDTNPYVAVEMSIDDNITYVDIVSTVPAELAKAIENYRRKWLTLDYDCKSMICKAKLINALNQIKNFRVYETYRGYHVRALLPRTLSLEEIIEMRKRLGDDEMRIIIDKIYIDKNMAFLTNLLFNEKCWVDGNEMRCSAETETSLDNIITEYMKERLIEAYGKISLSLSEIVKKSDVKVVNNTIVIKTDEAGRLIGKQGINVRTVEKELGVKVRIVSQTR
ncbi:MAG: KH domain-containing protein, partial [Acidilobaceae archaeon]